MSDLKGRRQHCLLASAQSVAALLTSFLLPLVEQQQRSPPRPILLRQASSHFDYHDVLLPLETL